VAGGAVGVGVAVKVGEGVGVTVGVREGDGDGVALGGVGVTSGVGLLQPAARSRIARVAENNS